VKAYKAVKHTCSGNFKIAPLEQNSIVNILEGRYAPWPTVNPALTVYLQKVTDKYGKIGT